MKRFIPTATLILATSLLTCKPETKWSTYTSEEFGFAVLMPGAVSHESQSVPTVDGPQTLHSFTASGPNTASYGVFCSELVDWEGQEPALILDEVRDGGVSGVNGQLLNEREITLDGFPGRAITIRGEGGEYYLSNIYLVVGQVYHVLVTVFNLEDAEKDMAKFFSSFRLL